LVAHGMVDAIVPRSELRETLGTLLGHLGGSTV
jgi:acetyl-CoA carboxylase beta subunit